MKRLFILAVFFPALAYAQFGAPPVITAITPASGPPGAAVTIIGDHFDLPPGFACILPCPTKVLFDAVDVTPREASDERLVVIAPPHAPGVAVLTVMTGDARFVFGTFTYEGDPEAAYEFVLLPIYIDGSVPGVGGSQWQTDLWLRNDGGTGLSLAPWVCPTGQSCPAIFPLTRVLQPSELLHNLPAFVRAPTNNPGRILYYTKGAKLSTTLRVADVSRQSLNAGTELPILRSDDFATSTIQLLNVPAGSKFRHMLRIYDLTPSTTIFRVNVYKQVEGTASGEVVASFEMKTVATQTPPFRDLPNYAQSELNPYFPAALEGPLRIEVVAQTPGARFWSFVSITNNDTQLVTLSTPQ